MTTHAEKKLKDDKREALKSILIRELEKRKNLNNTVTATKSEKNVVSAKYSVKQIRDEIIQILSDLLKISKDELDLDYPLDEFGLDSMGQASLLKRINDKFEIEIEVDEMMEFTNINEISAFVYEKAKDVHVSEHIIEDASIVGHSQTKSTPKPTLIPEEKGTIDDSKFDTFLTSLKSITSRKDEEIGQFREHLKSSYKTIYRDSKIKPIITTKEGEAFINFTSFDYMGYSSHPKVIQASKDALDKYGLGSAAAPMAGGMLSMHEEFQDEVKEFLKKKDTEVTLFISGYNACFGTVSGYMNEGDHVILDAYIHASLVDGAIFSKANVHFFMHNNMNDLEYILKSIDNGTNRILVCTEGCFSADGDFGDIKGVVEISKKYGAKVLVDEAHSLLVTGKNGRGVCYDQGVLDQVDFLIGTLSKTFSGSGGFLLAKTSISKYIDYAARNRMFSTTLPASITAGVMESMRLAQTKDGDVRRKKLKENGQYIKSLLKGKVKLTDADSWVVPVIIGDEQKTIEASNYLKEKGVYIPILVFPAAPKGAGRLRLFITIQHTKKQLQQAANLIIETAEKFECSLKPKKREIELSDK